MAHALETPLGELISQGKTNAEIEVLFRRMLNEINTSCKENINHPEEAGVENPSKIANDPLVAISWRMEDLEIGWLKVRGGGCGETKIDISTDQTIEEMVKEVLLGEALSK